MSPKWLAGLAAIVLVTSSVASADSKLLRKDSLLSYTGSGGMFAAPLTIIHQGSISNLTNTGGTLTFNPTTQTLTMMSTITEIIANGQVYTGDFGSITLTTGPLSSGSILGTATFFGGSFTITTNGTDGLPNGTFLSEELGTIHWRPTGNNNEFYLEAPFGRRGNVHEFSTWTGGNTLNVDQGAVVIPEPGTLTLLVTGVIGLIGAVRKKAGSIPGREPQLSEARI